jgi:ribosomal protein S18 acetylase RimI-like enzyme
MRVGDVVLRPARQADRAAIGLLVEHEVTGATNTEAVAYFLRLALDGRSDESRVIVAEDDRNIIGFVLYGEVAGALGTGRVHFINVTITSRHNSIGRRLCEAATTDLTSRGARLVLVELPDDASSIPGRGLLARCGFVETARVADYYRDGVDLIVFHRLIGHAP